MIVIIYNDDDNNNNDNNNNNNNNNSTKTKMQTIACVGVSLTSIFDIFVIYSYYY